MADSKDTTITINPAQSSELIFDVSMTGIEDSHVPIVRFVAVSKTNKCDYSFVCKKVDGEKSAWRAMITALTHITEHTLAFRIEVIVDGYFFQPAQGTLNLIQAPVATIKAAIKDIKESTTASVVRLDTLSTLQDDVELNLDLTKTISKVPFDLASTPTNDVVKESGSSQKTEDNFELLQLPVILNTSHNEVKLNLDLNQTISNVLFDLASAPTNTVERLPVIETKSSSHKSEGGKGLIRKLAQPIRVSNLFRKISSIRESKQSADTPETKAAKEANAARVREILG